MLTILEASKMYNDPLVQGVVEVFAANNPILERLPFENVAGNSYRYNRESTLPGIAFRGFNESYVESTGVLNPITEALTILGGDSDVDTAQVAMAQSLADIRANHDSLKAKALTMRWLRNFFQGDSATQPREFDGLQIRLNGTTQEIAAGSAGGATLDLDHLDQLLDAIVGRPDLILCNKTMRRKVNALMRASGAATETISDVFGRQVPSYAGVPIGVVEEDESGSEILDFTEDDGAGNPDTTSIYCVKFGLDAMHGIQTHPVIVKDLGEVPDKPAYRTRIEWYSGIAIKHPRAIARLKWINNT